MGGVPVYAQVCTVCVYTHTCEEKGQMRTLGVLCITVCLIPLRPSLSLNLEEDIRAEAVAR